MERALASELAATAFCRRARHRGVQPRAVRARSAHWTGRSSSGIRSAAWSRRSIRCCGPRTARGSRTVPAPPIAPWSTSSIGCRSRGNDGAYTLRRVWLSRGEERGYYHGFSNTALWPLCHVAFEPPRFTRNDWRHYQDVNRRFADAVMARGRPRRSVDLRARLPSRAAAGPPARAVA